MRSSSRSGLKPTTRMHSPKLLIVSATRVSPAAFVESTLLGRSFRRLCFDDRLEMRPAFNNRDGLAAVYNRQIREENREKILLFVHDDVWLEDYFICDRLEEALKEFDVVGVAGNTRRVSRQPSWCYVSESPFVADSPLNLSGVVAHGPQPGAVLNRYGISGRACMLLDGLFLAARCGSLLDAEVRFDERFDFHFYDMDFCRGAEKAGLRIGTWPIAVTHASFGLFGTPAWRSALQVYLDKWGE